MSEKVVSGITLPIGRAIVIAYVEFNKETRVSRCVRATHKGKPIKLSKQYQIVAGVIGASSR